MRHKVPCVIFLLEIYVNKNTFGDKYKMIFHYYLVFLLFSAAVLIDLERSMARRNSSNRLH